MSLISALKSRNSSKFYELIQSPSVSFQEQDPKTGRTVIHILIENDDIAGLSFLFDFFSNNSNNTQQLPLNNTDFYGLTPLVLSIINNRTQGLELLLKNGAEVNYKLSDGRTALHYAAENSYLDNIEKLIKFGVDLNVVCNEGGAIHIALKNDKQEIALRLLEIKNERLNFFEHIDKDANSCLHISVIEGSHDVFRELIKINSELDIENMKKNMGKKNNKGNTFLHEIAYYERDNMIKIIKKEINNIDFLENIKNKEGKTFNDIIEIKEKEKIEEIKKIEERKFKNLEKNKEKQEIKQRQIKELEINEKIEKEKKEKIKQIIEEGKNQSNTKNILITIIIIIIVIIGMYLALNFLEKKKKENYLD